MSIDRSDPRTWHDIEGDPLLGHLARAPHFYDGDVREDLALMKACGLALQRRFPDARIGLHFEDDGTMHVEVEAPGVRPASIFVSRGRFLVYVDVDRPDELMAEVTSPADVVNTLEGPPPERASITRE